MIKFNCIKNKPTKLILIIGYTIALVIIGLGFIVGQGYNVYDTDRAVEIHFWHNQHQYEELKETFDGRIDKYEGWYGLSWKNTYSLYGDRSNLSYEQFESLCREESGFPHNYTSWSEREYVDYISDVSVYNSYGDFDRDYVWIILNNKVTYVAFGPTYSVDDYEGVIPKIIHICLILLLLPLLSYVIVIVINNYRKRKDTDIMLMVLSYCMPIIGLVLGIVYRVRQDKNITTSTSYFLTTLASVISIMLVALCYYSS